jgi:subtilisin family serine protease
MKTLARITLLTAALVSCASAGDQFLLRTPSGKVGEFVSRHKLSIVRALQGSGRDLFVVKLPAGANAGALASDPASQGVESDGAVTLPELAAGVRLPASANSLSNLGRPTAVSFYGAQALGAYVNQPAMLTIQLAGARVFSSGGGIVAILDTGVDTNHPVLKNSLVPGYDFTRNQTGGSEMLDLYQSTTAVLDMLQSTTSVLDKSKFLVLNQSTTAILDVPTSMILDGAHLPSAFGHGTMVAGLVHLVAPNAKIMPIKVFTGDGVSSISQVVDGIYYAVDHGAKVINMSFSSEASSPELMKAVDYAKAKGVVCISSVGNSGSKNKTYPAADGDVIGVGSTNNLMVRSPFSNYGNSLVSLAAPGEGVITLYPGNNYAAAWGTSFSTPLVSGGAALLVAQGSSFDQARAEKALTQAIPIGQELGSGELDLFLACLYQALHRY